MLFIIAISSIGMPLITHSCSHDNKKDVHVFSSEHHCDDKCSANEIPSENLGFSEMPCCSFETNFLKNDDFFSSINKTANKHYISLYSLFLPKEKNVVLVSEQLNYKSYPHKSYGYKYRIAMQSFLC